MDQSAGCALPILRQVLRPTILVQNPGGLGRSWAHVTSSLTPLGDTQVQVFLLWHLLSTAKSLCTLTREC